MELAKHEVVSVFKEGDTLEKVLERINEAKEIPQDMKVEVHAAVVKILMEIAKKCAT